MALNEEVFEIVDGPNDWDMWLSLREKWRGVKHVVGFKLDRPAISENILRLELDMAATGQFTAKITSLEIPEQGLVQWLVRGRVCYCGLKTTKVNITFQATYNHKERRGEVRFQEE
jgi:hypothetical protein